MYKKKTITTSPNKPELNRVSMNLPTELLVRIDDYATKLYVNRTTAFTILLNTALNTDKALGDMSELLNLIKEQKGV